VDEVGSIKVVLFDIGGVLVEITGIHTLRTWTGGRMTVEQLWTMWLSSPAVRSFETGRCGVDQFAEDLIREMELPVNTKEFLLEFEGWPRRLMPGAHDLIRAIPPEYTRATLSNTNAIHWPRLHTEMELGLLFEHHFASHLTGKIKPDREAFQHVVNEMRRPAEQILFLDDNAPNVSAATEVGMNAVRVTGVPEAERALIEAGVLQAQV